MLVCARLFDGTLKDIEIIFVDDGSRDKTVEEVKKLRQKDERVHLVSFSRNFGKEAAMFAGLQNSNARYACILDADLVGVKYYGTDTPQTISLVNITATKTPGSILPIRT